MLRALVGRVKETLGIDDDVVAMGLTILALGALAQVFAAMGKVVSLKVSA